MSMLLEKGYSVVGIDNLNNSYDIQLKHYRLDILKKHRNFQFYKLDIENVDALDILFSHHTFDAVVNLAARAGVRYSMINPHVYISTNTYGTLNLLEMMKKHGINKFVLASTSSLYAGQPIPFHEDLPVNTPISTYAASKKAAEVIAYSYHFLFDIDVSVVRYFTVFGPAGRPDMSIFRFIKWIDEGTPITLFGDGSQTRDFTYSEDIAEGTVRALLDLGYEIINLGGGKTPISMNQVIRMIEELLGKKSEIHYQPFNKSDLKKTNADISKAYRLLDWKPKIDFLEGLHKTVTWHMKNREWIKEINI